MNEKRKELRKNQTRRRISLISEREASFYPEAIDSKEYWDEIYIKRHTPIGIEEIRINLFMSHRRVDCVNVSQDGYFLIDNNRLVQMGMYRFGEFLAGILGRRRRMDG